MVEHVVRFQGVKALKASHPQVRLLKRQGHRATAHGNKVWRSSFVLIDYLYRRGFAKGVRVLDVGCGWGLMGIAMAKKYEAEVTGVDIDPNVAPFLELQASINNCEIAFHTQSFKQITQRQLASYDVILGADICFWDEMTKPLLDLLTRAAKAGVEFAAIADPGRPPFWALAERAQDRLGAWVGEHRISKPWRTTKHLLVLDNDDR